MNNRVFFLSTNVKRVLNKILTLFLIAIVIIFAFRSCQLKREVKSAQQELVSVSQEKETMRKEIDSQGKEISSLNAIVVNRNRAIEKQLKEIKQLKTLDTKIVFRDKTIIDTKTIELHDTAFISKTDTIHFQTFDYTEKWFSIKGKIEKKSLIIDSLQIENEYDIEVGKSKAGLFKKEERVYIKNQNPYTHTQSMKSYVLKDPKKWYERDVWKIAVTAIATTFLVRNL